MKNLVQQKDLMIQKADKDNTVVITDGDKYIELSNRYIWTTLSVLSLTTYWILKTNPGTILKFGKRIKNFGEWVWHHLPR